MELIASVDGYAGALFSLHLAQRNKAWTLMRSIPYTSRTARIACEHLDGVFKNHTATVCNVVRADHAADVPKRAFAKLLHSCVCVRFKANLQ
jgi:hypothetical protein